MKTQVDRARAYLARAVSIREPGQVKGVRLFHLNSILDFIAKCETSAGAEKESAQ